MPQNSLEYQRQWERENKDKRRAYNKKYREKMRKWYNDLKSTMSCMDCGESHIACIVFHHRNPKEKRFNVADRQSVTSSKKRLLEEIAKCDVLCSNCHRKRHYEMRQQKLPS